MTGFDLKIIAMLTMLIDHIGSIFFPRYIALRIIGRLSFMLYCFLLVQGYTYTRNLKKYLLRILIFAFISEIPFNLAFYNSIFYIYSQNIFFTLFLGLICIYLCEHFYSSRFKCALSIIICCIIAEIIKCDYGAIGILMIIGFYLFKNNFNKLFLWELIFTLFLPLETASLISFIFIKFYNGQKGKNLGYAAYLFYPLHLIILYFITLII